MGTIIERIKTCMVEHLKLVKSVDEIKDDTELTSLGLDSMGATNLMIDLEDEFDITFPDALLTPETFKTTLTLDSAIQTLLNSQA
ncbi:MAG: acyl carrier protein [Moorea sp. SIOASIH]|uniref:phosphopantetheine-binding protein n=1 Tax=Moorena sp. SIOASIH TaxID=2607817 RepID=UPI0013BB872C|nr:phosphopantetheine-binding protein [Moorena sp. SIOASIH]NEO41270.1 acyl carrier protein [Moorena sp. SIOASIH]